MTWSHGDGCGNRGILYKDTDFLALDKPEGWSVNPGQLDMWPLRIRNEDLRGQDAPARPPPHAEAGF